MRQNLYDGILDSCTLQAPKYNTQISTLTGNVTLTANHPTYQVLDPGGADRTLTLPAEATSKGAIFIFQNSASDVGEELIIQDDGTTEIGRLAKDDIKQFICDGVSWRDFAIPDLVSQALNDTLIGTVGAAPASGTNSVVITRIGNFFDLTFTLTACQVPVTDGAGAGSYGTYKLFDFVAGAQVFLGCRQDYTAFVEGAALTGGAGDAIFDIGVGSVAIATEADGALAGTDDDIGTEVLVDLGGTGVGTGVNGAAAALNGTATASDLNLNWSGTAATIDANSTIDVTGTIQIAGVMLGDD